MTQTRLPLTAERFLTAASAFYASGRLAEAEHLYRALLADHPDNFAGLHALGLICLARDAPKDAEPLLARALSVNPESAEARNDLGTALASQGRQEEAIPQFKRAIALSPDFSTAHNNLGNALASQDRDKEAIALFERAIALRPDYALAEFNLANLLSKRERYRDAAGHFRKALGQNPDWIAALCGLGFALHMSDRHEEALQYYERACALDPSSAAARHGIGLVKQVIGRLEEARTELEKAVELAPGTPSYHRFLAEAKRFQAGDPQIAAMEKLAARSASLGDEQQMELHFALGKAYGDIGRHKASFAHLVAGNAIKCRLEPFDEAAHLDMMRHIRRVFTADLLARNAGVGDPSDLPVFILGMPRSGSTLVEQILSSHPQFLGAGELRYLGEATKAFRGKDVKGFFPEVANSLSSEQLREFGAAYVEQLRALAPGASRVTDKMPSNFRFVGLIRMALPNARIIHTRRNAVDTCLSCFSRLFGKKSFMSDLGTLGRYYRAYENLMAHWRAVLSPGAMLEVQYEDLVGDFENQARRVVDYCGLPWDDRCLTFFRTERAVRTASVTQVRQPIYRESIGRWQPYGSMLTPLFEALEDKTYAPRDILS